MVTGLCPLAFLQAVIQGAFTSDEAADTEGTAAETHYAYFPGAAVGDGAGTAAGSAAAVVTTQGSEALLGQATPPGTGEMLCEAWAAGSGGQWDMLARRAVVPDC